ncbi:MAG: hypothetical protein K0R18_2867, partial [Bacillales bacterium]|nr:hypothetical protein [Bacillales bacterium]
MPISYTVLHIYCLLRIGVTKMNPENLHPSVENFKL